MNWISGVFFIISFLVCLTQLKRGADVISPARVFGFTWSIVFALASLKLSGLQYNWTFMQWVYSLLGPLSFLVGLFVAYVLNMNSRLKSITEMRMSLRECKVDRDKLFYCIVAAFATYITGYIVIYLVKGYIPIFALNPAAARAEYYIFGVGLLIHHMPIVFFFSLVYHVITRDDRTRKNILKGMMVISVLTYFLLLQRYHLILVAVMAFTLLYYVTTHIRFRTAALFVISGVLLIYSIASLRFGQIVATVLYTASQMKFAPQFAIFTEPYMYMVMNVENFVRATSKLDQFSYGYYSFDFLFALTGLKYPLRDYFGLVENPYLMSGYNTYTIFWTYYRDFGVVGISLLPLAAGLFVGSLYYTMRRNPTIGLVSMYSIIVFLMALSFFLSPIGFLWFVYVLTVMAVILKFVRLRNQR